MMLKYVTKSEFNAATGCHSHLTVIFCDLRPLALRPCLSTGLPLYIQYMVFMGIPGFVMYMGALISMMICQLKKIKKMELITIASAGCALAYAAGACFGNSMYYTTPYFYMFLGMTARTIKLENTK